jgi:membrane-associated protein
MAGKRRESGGVLLPYWSWRIYGDSFARPGAGAGSEPHSEEYVQVLESIRQLLHSIYDVEGLIRGGGPLLVCIVVFVETGLFVGFFLPGDSLLVTAGVFAAAGTIPLRWLLIPVMLCAIVGDQIGYWIGRAAGASLYKREESFFFRRSHLQRAHDFYEKYGGKTVILARFVPIIRTFCPPVAGAAGMPYSRYLTYDIFGGIIWVGSMIMGGFLLGRSIPNVGQKIHYVIAVVIVVSLLPAVISIWRERRNLKKGSSTKSAVIEKA